MMKIFLISTFFLVFFNRNARVKKKIAQIITRQGKKLYKVVLTNISYPFSFSFFHFYKRAEDHIPRSTFFLIISITMK